MKINLKYIDWEMILGIGICIAFIGLLVWVIYSGHQDHVQIYNQRKNCFAMECPFGTHPYFIDSDPECVCVTRNNKK